MMEEQRTKGLSAASSSNQPSQPHYKPSFVTLAASGSNTSHQPEPAVQARTPKPPSITSLRGYPSRRAGIGQVHSRRTSLDMDNSSVPGSPITYFPNPSTFNHSATHPTRSPSINTLSLSTTSREAASAFSGSSEDECESIGTALGPLSTSATEMASGESSPRVKRSSTVSGVSSGSSFNTDLRRSSTATITAFNSGIQGVGQQGSGGASRTIHTPVGYGATHASPALAGLGFGKPEYPGRRRKDKDDALASPRRISTSQGPPPLPPVHRSPASYLHLPLVGQGHGNYYAQSQPGSSTSPKFRDHSLPESDQHDLLGVTTGSGPASTAVPSLTIPGPSKFAHRRTTSSNSMLNSPIIAPSSPAASIVKRIRKTASAVGLAVGKPANYDEQVQPGRDDDEEEDAESNEGMKANGMRVWYSSFVAIDWMHDAIKDSARVRRLRHNAPKSIRGSIANTWDRFQGWLVVTIIGMVSAVIAFLIVRTEMALFDLKEGFCASSWGSPRRFCCAPRDQSLSTPEICGDWVEWGEFLAPDDMDGGDSTWALGGPQFLAYIVIAVLLASVSSTMTVYLSSSAQHTTSKDSTLISPPVASEDPHATKVKRKSSPNSERQPLLESSTSTLEEEPKVLREQPRKVMYYAAGSGIPEIKTILSGFVIHGYLGGWTLITKSVGLALSVASGLSLGKEGPLVHISSCVGNIVSRLFLKFECNEAKRREVLSAACAAGVSVAFGAPIGGVLFSLEEVSYYFPPKVMWRSFWCAAVAAITLKGLNPFGNHSLVLFEVTYTKPYRFWEFGIFILLGVFGGVYGAVFSRLNILWARRVRQETWVKHHPIVEVVLVTILTTLLSFLNPFTRMGGTEFIASLFAECSPDVPSDLCVAHPKEVATVMWPLAMALLIKGCLTIITFGIRVPAGIFIPSLVVGACAGRIAGLGMEWLEWTAPQLSIFRVCRDTQCVVPGIYAMVGAAATLAGVTRTTVSLAVIVMELTGTLNYVVPVMLGVLVAKTVADGLERRGIYDLVIELNQLPYLDSKHEYLWGGRQAAEVADREVPVLRADKTHTVRSLTAKLLELVRVGMADSGFPVLVKESVDADGRLFSALRVVGFLGMSELEHALARLADEPDAQLNLMPEDANVRQARSSVMSIFSFAESYSDSRHNPYDISRYIDRAPITVQIQSPLELVQQLFVKLGARQVVVTDARGVFRGVVTKKAWLAFLKELEDGGR